MKLICRALPLLMLGMFHLAQAQEAPQRLRTLFPNGAILLVENISGAATASVQLFASSRRLPDTPENHGYRHLLEHLLLKGPAKDLDLRLESQGMVLLGKTLRDAMQIEVRCEASQIPAAMDALGELLKPIHVSVADIASEVSVMRQEDALQSDALRLSRAEWAEAFGEQGLDPFGETDVMAKATPEALSAYQEELFAANNLVLVISGPFDVETQSKAARGFLKDRSGKASAAEVERAKGIPGRTQIDDAFGEARAARVPGFREPSAAGALAAALAVASQLENAFVIYTPSAGTGLIIVGRSDENSGVGLKIDSLEEGDIAALFPLGKLLAHRWLVRQLESPSSSASIRGLLLCQGPSYKPEQMLENIDALKWPEFIQGFHMFSKDNADIAVGVRH
jgi:hypothetical protein